MPGPSPGYADGDTHKGVRQAQPLPERGFVQGAIRGFADVLIPHSMAEWRRNYCRPETHS